MTGELAESVAVASEWLELVYVDRDLGEAWPLTEPLLRQQFVGFWFDSNKDHPWLRDEDRNELIAALAVEDPTHELWLSYAHAQIDGIRRAWSWLDLERYRWSDEPRSIGPDQELALLVDTQSGREGLRFLMHHHTGSWLLASFHPAEKPKRSKNSRSKGKRSKARKKSRRHGR